MKTINVDIKEKETNYNVIIGNSILNKLVDTLKKENKKVVVIMDFTIKNLYENKIMGLLNQFNPLLISVLSGESSKSRSTKQEVEDLLLVNKLGRDTIIVAIGGGVIGDLSGYVASTYNRGIDYIQIPTSLLAMVDSSIGGKTGINTKHGKNLIGSIWQPKEVLVDLDFLKTLPDEEFLNGLVEIIKISLILDKNLFEFIEQNHKQIIERNSKSLMHLITRSIELKKEIVQKDERENNLRQVLNFGHTVGHAIENQSNYSEKHGFCIAKGIFIETLVAENLNVLDKKHRKRIIELFNKLKFDLSIKYDINELINIMKLDKKSKNNKIFCVLLVNIGKIKSNNSQYSFEIDEKIMRNALK
jgi:3-dehydroquinate synthase